MPRIYSRHKRAQAVDPIPADAVYCGRPSPYGNPFAMRKEEHRNWACDEFEVYARLRLEHDPAWLEPLRGKDLVCWCQNPSQEVKPRCHCETLLALANQGD